MSGRSGWKWAGLFAGVAALWFSYARDGAPYITNDGYQYLDAAANLAAGECLCTQVALFDEQIAFGRFPIPFTHFAPGYPILIAGLSRAGLKPESAGYLVSAAGFLAAIWLVQDVAVALGASACVAAAFSLIWITHATALLYGSAVETESLFTALLLALAALVVRDVRAQGAKRFLPIGIGLVAGLAYWIRYPGLFLVGSAGLYLITRAWRVPRERRGAIAGLLTAASLIAAVQIRNSVYTGSWRGGFKSGSGQTLREVAIGTVRAFAHLVTGDRLPVRFGAGLALLVLCAALALFLGIRAWTRRDAAGMGWALFIGIVYVGGVMVAALTTIAADLPRYYFPVYPLFLACAAAFCSTFDKALPPVFRSWYPPPAEIGFRAPTGRERILQFLRKCPKGGKSLVVVLLVFSVVAVEARNLFVPSPAPDWIVTKAILAEEVQPGVPLDEWLRQRLGRDGTMAAVEGQAVHYILQSPIVAVIPAGATSRRGDGPAFQSLMRQFHAQYLLLFPGLPPDRIPEQSSYAFLRQVALGDAPKWLEPAARTRDAAVYRCVGCAN
jgi:hypothetical protein